MTVQYGRMEVTNHRSLQKSIVNFKACGWFDNDLHKIEGFLIDKEWVLTSFLAEIIFLIFRKVPTLDN